MSALLDKTILLVNDFKLDTSNKSDQNFLVDEQIIKKEVSAAGLRPEDTVLDIGAGPGYLLEELAKTCKVVAIEKDVKLFSYLLNKYELVKDIKLINGDALSIIFPGFNKVVSNPPYTIVDRILTKLTRYNFDSGVMIIPKTIADGLTGSPDYKKPNKFIMIQRIFFEFKDIADVPREAFYPPPRVMSKMIALRRKPYDFMQGVMKRDEMTVKNAILRTHQELGEATKRESKGFLSGLRVESLGFADKEIKRLKTEELERLVSFVDKNYSVLHG